MTGWWRSCGPGVRVVHITTPAAPVVVTDNRPPWAVMQGTVSDPQEPWVVGQPAVFDELVINTRPDVFELDTTTGRFTTLIEAVFKIQVTIQGSIDNNDGWGYFALARAGGPIVSPGGLVLPATYPFGEGVTPTFEWAWRASPGQVWEIRLVSSNDNTVTIRSDVYSGFLLEHVA